MTQYFPTAYEPFSGDINVKVDLSNYAAKTDIKNILHVDTSSFALKSNLASLKTEVDQLDIDKLVFVPVDLSRLSDVVKNDVVKETVYDKLVAKVNNIDTSDFVLKTKYQTDKTELENKISITTGLVKKIDYNAKITEMKCKIASISGLATNAALTTVENKILNISSLVKISDYNSKIIEIEKKRTDHNHDKYITNPEFNNLAASIFNARLPQANLITKTDFDAKLSSINGKITSNKTKHLLVENELKNLKAFDSSYFICNSHFEEDGTQNYLVFQLMYKCFKRITSNYILSWESKGLSDENITPPCAPYNFLTPSLNYLDSKLRVRFSGCLLK